MRPLDLGIGLACVVVGAAAVYVLARDPEPSVDQRARDVPVASSSPSPSEAGPDSTTPEVPLRVDVDFAEQQRVPAGFRVFETDLNESGMRVQGGRLTHGAPTAANGASYLENELPTEVERLGAEVKFANGGRSGAAVLIAWEDSLVDTRTDRNTLPRSGIHFVAYPGRWHLGIIDPAADQLEDIVERRTYDGADGPQEFDLVRRDDTVWVTDPTGAVTQIRDPRIAQYAGPWANWELYEPTAESEPAAFERVWAG